MRFNRKKTILQLAVLITVLFVCQRPLLANSTSNLQLSASLPAFPPFFTQKKQGAMGGSVVRLYKLLEKASGLHFNISPRPYARVLADLKTGNLDLAILFENADLKPFVSLIGPISYSQVILLSFQYNAINDWDDLHNLNSVGVIRKASFGHRFDNDKAIKKFSINNYLQGLQMLRQNRIQGLIGSKSGLEFAISQSPIKWNQLAPPFVVGNKAWMIHFSNRSKHPEIIPSLRRAVEKLYRPELIYDLCRQK